MHDKASTRPKRQHNCTGPKLSRPEWGNMRCSKCGADNREAARFCDGCGAQLPVQCPSCAILVRAGARFCDSCGAALPGSPPRIVTPPEGAATIQVHTDGVVPDTTEGERKTVTALFADIKGSTELIRELDPEEARAVIDPVHEDHPQRAVHAAIAMRDALRRRDVDQPGQQSRSASASTPAKWCCA